MNEVQEAAILEERITALGEDATSEEILHTISGFNQDAINIALHNLGGGGGGGGAGTVTLLGPFAVTYQTPGVTDPADFGAHVGPELAPGTIVIAAWTVVTQAWTTDGPAVDGIYANLVPEGVSISSLANVAPAGTTPSVLASGDNPQQRFISEAQNLAVAVYSETGTANFTAGALNIYALVVTA